MGHKPGGRPTQTNGNSNLKFSRSNQGILGVESTLTEGALVQNISNRLVERDAQGRVIKISYNASALLLDDQNRPISYRDADIQNLSTVQVSSFTFTPEQVNGMTLGLRGVRVTKNNSDLNNSGSYDGIGNGLKIEILTSQSASDSIPPLDAAISEEVNSSANIVFNNSSIAAYRYYEADGKTIRGGNGSDFLYGGSTDEILDGQGSNDYMNGGGGNDVYIVDDSRDYIAETPQTGVETVKSSVDWSLNKKYFDGSNVVTGIDHLILTGTNNIDGSGNYLSNDITGNSGNNVLTGFGTIDDLVIPEAQRSSINQSYRQQVDTLKGGGGRDTFVIGSTLRDFYDLSGDRDYAQINGFTPGLDQVRVSGTVGSYKLSNRGRDILIRTATNELIAIVDGSEVANLGQVRSGLIQAS